MAPRAHIEHEEAVHEHVANGPVRDGLIVLLKVIHRLVSASSADAATTAVAGV